MPFSFSEAINNLSDKVLASSFIKKVSGNPIYGALLLTVVILVVILLIFRDVDELSVLSTSASIYIFFVLLAGLFLHDKILIKEIEAKSRNSEIESVFSSVSSAATAIDDDVVPVPITYDANIL